MGFASLQFCMHCALGRLLYTILTLITHKWIWRMPKSNSDSDLDLECFVDFY